MELADAQTNLLKEVWTLLGRPIKKNKPAWTSSMEARDVLKDQQLPFSSLVKIGTVLHINIQKESAEIFQISPKTLQRRKKEHRLNYKESETVFRTAEILVKATDVFDGEETAIEWLKEENRALGGKIPLSLLGDDIGRKLVEDVLARIKHGIYS